MLKHGSDCLFEHDHAYISFMWEMFLLLNLELLSVVKMPPRRLQARPHIIVHSGIVSRGRVGWHWLLRIESKILGGLPHHNPFIAQLMSGLPILQVHTAPRYLIFK